MNTISPEHALTLVKQYWNIEGSVKKLPSYSDQNFKISLNNHAYVFKIAHPSTSLGGLELENAALLHLEKTCTDLVLPQVKKSLLGEHLIPIQINQNQVSYIRLLTYVEGDVYANVAASKNKTKDDRKQLLISLGSAVGKVAKGLSDFNHANAQRALDWNLTCLPKLNDEINQLEDSELKTIVQKHMSCFTQYLPHYLSTLPMSINHNDANDFNVIVDSQDHQRVCSIIDFGDTCFSFRIADLAITCTYAMQFEDNIIDCMSSILIGYHSQHKLNNNEINVLYPFVMARLCQSILMANKAIRANPENTYILVSQQAVRQLIRTLHHLDEQVITQQFLKAVQ